MVVASAVLHSQKVPGLSDVTKKRIIGFRESFMRIVSTRRILDLISSGEHRAIEVERDAFEIESCKRAQDD